MKIYSKAICLAFSSGLAIVAMTTSAKASEADNATQKAGVVDAGASDQDAGVGDIVVTAEKRSGSLQRTPISITALSGEALTRSNITDVEGLSAKVPGFNFGESFGVAKLSLRGISFSSLALGADPSVAFNLNGVYISRPAGQLGSFYDIGSVEVLRGPQGTLYGRNATAGAVNVTSAQPTNDFSGYARLAAGNFSTIAAEGALNLPLGDDLAVRFAGQGRHHGGYGKNLLTGQKIDDLDTFGGRISLKWSPGDNFSALLIADYDYEKDNAYGLHVLAQGGLTGEPGSPGIGLSGLAFGGQAIFNSRDTLNDYVPEYDREQYGLVGDLTWSLGDSIDLRSISGYRHLKWGMSTDLDGTSYPLAFLQEGEKASQFSQEFDLSGEHSWGRWTVGAYYFHEKLSGGITLPQNLGNLLPAGQYFKFYFGGGDIKTDAYALFGQATIKITDRLSATVGARYSHEKKSEVDLYTDFVNSFDYFTPYVVGQPPIAPPFHQSTSFEAFTPKVGLEFQANPDTMLYASYSRGFKAGNFNLGGAFTLPGQPNNPINEPVKQESIDAFDAGLKTTMFDRRLRLNLAGFYYKYKNLQVSQVTSLVVLLENAASAEIYGAELEMTAQPTDRLQLDLAASWLHARFKSFNSVNPNICPAGFDSSQLAFGLYPCLDVPGNTQNLSGNAMPQAPDWTLNAAAQYTIPIGRYSVALRGELVYVDKVYFDEFNRDVLSQPANTKVNAFVTFSDEGSGLDIKFYGNNIFNKKTVANAYTSGFGRGYPVFGVFSPPREFGVQVSKRF